jgi:hypothetical protein
LSQLARFEGTARTIRDLTGVDLRPAREFPADGAAGEVFWTELLHFLMGWAHYNRPVSERSDWHTFAEQLQTAVASWSELLAIR